jgi:hypothetical protein
MQKVFITYRENVESQPLGELHVGFLKPGRYNGFRTLSAVSGLNLSIGHDHPQTVKKNVAGYNHFGAIVTTNGSIVHESDPINVTLDTNFGNENERFDLLLCEHQYVSIIGGQPATYTVIKGAYDGSVPIIPNPEKQVLIGTFRLAPGAYNIATGITYTPEVAKLPGDMTQDELSLAIVDATTLVKGVVRYATEAEAIARVNDLLALTPITLMAMQATQTLKGVAEIATPEEAIAGTDNERIVTPFLLKAGRGKVNLSSTVLPSGPQDFIVTPEMDGQHVIIRQAFGPGGEVEVKVPVDLPQGTSLTIVNNRAGGDIPISWLSPTGLSLIYMIAGKTASIKYGGTVNILSTHNPNPSDPLAISIPTMFLTGDLGDSD